MELTNAAHSPYYSEIKDNYYIAQPMTHSQSTTESKIDEVLMRVRRIDKELHNGGVNRPVVPPKPPSKPGRVTSPKMPYGVSSSDVPPPRPDKSRRSSTLRSSESSKTLPKPECDFLVVQLKNVRTYLDEMVDDDFDGKLENISTIDSVISALLCP